ncbi:MAG: geranylgeranyl reductase family protein [Proteobacteria bacterium]|nr:geranylgeranyl reductase family protein [Pseudomonadota bacterium]
MPMTSSFDAIIAGGGPAGAAAARVLAGRGYRVAVVDRAVFPRKKLCGGLLTWKTVRVLEAVFGLDETALREQGLVDYEADSYALLHRGRVFSRDQGFHPFLLVDRSRFDAHLLGLAQEAGAEVMQGVGAAHCIPAEGVVATTDGRELTGRFIIGADGANSRLRRALGVDRRRWYAGLARAVEFHVDRGDMPEGYRDLTEPELHVGYNRAGYAWVFPGRDRLCIGMCGLEEAGGACRTHFAEFLNQLGLDPEAQEIHGHPLPYGNWLANPCAGKLLLAGDAAGFVEPLLGEGIFYALMTGRYAAESIATALSSRSDPAEAYRARLGQFIVPELRGANVMRSVFLRSIALAGYAPFQFFMRRASRPLLKMVHGQRSWRFMQTKTWDF